MARKYFSIFLVFLVIALFALNYYFWEQTKEEIEISYCQVVPIDTIFARTNDAVIWAIEVYGGKSDVPIVRDAVLSSFACFSSDDLGDDLGLVSLKSKLSYFLGSHFAIIAFCKDGERQFFLSVHKR